MRHQALRETAAPTKEPQSKSSGLDRRGLSPPVLGARKQKLLGFGYAVQGERLKARRSKLL